MGATWSPGSSVRYWCSGRSPRRAADEPNGGNFHTVLNNPGRNIRHTGFTQHPRPAYFDRTEKGVPEAMGYSVRTRTFRYTEWRDWATGKLLSAELYDTTVPPEKVRNLIDEAKETDELKAARSALHDRFRLK